MGRDAVNTGGEGKAKGPSAGGEGGCLMWAALLFAGLTLAYLLWALLTGHAGP